MKVPKDGKVKARGVTCVIIGYSSDHERNCYRMWNPETGRVVLSRDVTFLHHMYFEKENADATKQEPVVFIPIKNSTMIIEPEDADVELIGVRMLSTSREGDQTDGLATQTVARTVSYADEVEKDEEEAAD